MNSSETCSRVEDEDAEILDFIKFCSPGSVGVIVIYAFFIQRKYLFPSFLDGRPGIPVPINLIQEKSKRLVLSLIFTLSMFFLLYVFRVIDDLGLPGEGWGFLIDELETMLKIVSIAVIFYPAFVIYTSGSAIVATLALIDVVFLAVYTTAYIQYFIFCFGTHKGKEKKTLYLPYEDWIVDAVIEFGPIMIVLGIMVVVLPRRVFKLWQLGGHRISHPHEWGWTSNHETYHCSYVRSVLNPELGRKRDEEASFVWRFIWKYIYKPVPGVRVPIALTAGVMMALVTVQYLAWKLFESEFRANFYKQYTGDSPKLRPVLYNLLVDLPRKYGDKSHLTSAEVELTNNSTLIAERVEETDRFMAYFQKVMTNTFYVVLSLVVCATYTSILRSFANCQQHLLELYRGCHEHIPPPGEAKETIKGSVEYISCQVIYSLFGFGSHLFIFGVPLMFGITFFFICFEYSLWRFVWWAVRNALSLLAYTYIIFPLVVIPITKRFFVINDAEVGPILAINNHRCFLNFQYFMIFMAMPVAFVKGILRLVNYFTFGAWIVPRVDHSLFSPSYADCDAGFAAYVGMLHMEFVLNNPFMRTFIYLLSESLRHEDQLECPGDSDVVESRWKRRHRRKLVRNRWLLAYTLLKNPRLRVCRKVELMKKAEETMKVQVGKLDRIKAFLLKEEP